MSEFTRAAEPSAAALTIAARAQALHLGASEFSGQTGIERTGGITGRTTNEGRTLEANLVVAGLGIEPCTEFAVAAD